MFSKILKYIKNNKIFSSFLFVSFIIFIFFGSFIVTELIRQNKEIDNPIRISGSGSNISEEKEVVETNTIKSEDLFITCELVDYSYEKFYNNTKSYTWYEVQSYENEVNIFNQTEEGCIAAMLFEFPTVDTQLEGFAYKGDKKYELGPLIEGENTLYFSLHEQLNLDDIWLFSYNISTQEFNYIDNINKKVFANYDFKEIPSTLKLYATITKYNESTNNLMNTGVLLKTDYFIGGGCEGNEDLEQTAEVIKQNEQCRNDFEKDVDKINESIGIWYYDFETKTTTKILDL